MYRIGRPEIDSLEAYKNAVSAIRSDPIRAAYDGALDAVEACCEKFNSMAEGERFNEAQAVDYVISGLHSKGSMVDLYDKQFTGSLGSEQAKSSIRNAAPNNICPYCGDNMVAEIDHYLPKSSFAGIALHISNLVPICRDCNTDKKAYRPGNESPAILHPYYDTALDFKWLDAVLVLNEHGKPVLDFRVNTDTVGSGYIDRLNAHLQVLKLGTRFTTKGAQLLHNFETMIKSTEGSMDLRAAKTHLVRQISGYDVAERANVWEVSTYEAMLKSDWYLTDYLSLR